MDQASMKRLHEEAALWVWADRCGEAGERQLPRLILDCCQAGYDLAFGDSPPVARKRAVFEAVAAGRLDAAVKAMEGSGVRVALEDEGDKGMRARVEQLELGVSATASGRHPLGAELRGLMELLLLSEPAQRARVLS
jgi:hypothetical protein